MSERLKMIVEFEVKESQALALQAMFEEWNKLASWGSSGMVAFYVDGDGDFKPNCKISYEKPIRKLTDEMRNKCTVEKSEADILYDYDPIAWIIRNEQSTKQA